MLIRALLFITIVATMALYGLVHAQEFEGPGFRFEGPIHSPHRRDYDHRDRYEYRNHNGRYRRADCGELRAACLRKEQLGEVGQGNCQRYREQCR